MQSYGTDGIVWASTTIKQGGITDTISIIRSDMHMPFCCTCKGLQSIMETSNGNMVSFIWYHLNILLPEKERLCQRNIISKIWVMSWAKLTKIGKVYFLSCLLLLVKAAGNLNEILFSSLLGSFRLADNLNKILLGSILCTFKPIWQLE